MILERFKLHVRETCSQLRTVQKPSRLDDGLDTVELARRASPVIDSGMLKAGQ